MEVISRRADRKEINKGGDTRYIKKQNYKEY